MSVTEQQIAWYLSFETNINNASTAIACVYLSASENKTETLNSFCEWFENVSHGKQIVVCGDFIIDMLS